MLLKKNTSFSDLDFESAKNFETCWHGVYRIFNLKGHFNRLLWPTEAYFERFRNFPCIPHDALLRDAIVSKKCSFFEHCSNGGGGVNPCSKILSEIVVRSGGHLTT